MLLGYSDGARRGFSVLALYASQYSVVDGVQEMISDNRKDYSGCCEANVLRHAKRNRKVFEVLRNANVVFAGGTIMVRLAQTTANHFGDESASQAFS
jgi:hypothetical protein